MKGDNYAAIIVFIFQKAKYVSIRNEPEPNKPDTWLLKTISDMQLAFY